MLINKRYTTIWILKHTMRRVFFNNLSNSLFYKNIIIRNNLYIKSLKKIIIIAQFAILLLIILLFNPITNMTLTLYYAKKYGLNSSLYFRQIKAESFFRCFVKSKKGAIGVGQVIYTTAVYIDSDIKKWELYLPWRNLDISSKYMQYLLERYQNNYSLALAAYNWGETNVSEKLRENNILIEIDTKYDYLFQNVRETYSYIEKIMK